MSGLIQLPRTVWLLGLISLLNDSASEMVYPLLPLYLTSVMASSPRFLGLMEGIAESMAALLKLASGVLSDRFSSRKTPVLIGYGLAGISRPLYALAGSVVGIFALRILDRLGKALRSAPRDAMLFSAVAPEKRGLAFGLHRSMDHAGAVVGPLLAYGLIASGADLKTTLLWSIVPGVLCVILASAISEPAVADAVPKNPAWRWQWRFLPKPFQRYLITLVIFSLGNASNMFLLLRAHELGLSVSHSLLCWAAMAVIATLLTTPISSFSDRVDRRLILTAGWLAYALLQAFFAWAPGSFLMLLTMFVGMGLVSAATEGVEKALVADVLEPSQKASAFGWFYLASGLPLLVASVGFGTLWQQYSPSLAFTLSAVLAFTAALMLWFWVPARTESN